jgi:hypothetical protein
VTTLHGFGGVLRPAFGHYFLGSHNFMVMALGACVKQSPTLGADAHPYPWVLGGYGCDVIVHGWASVLCILASSSKSESNFSDAGNTLTKKRSELKPTTVNDFLFVRSNQDLV